MNGNVKRKSNIRAIQETAVRPTHERMQQEMREQMIAESAYFRAHKCGFAGDPLRDWLEAEDEIDRLLRNGFCSPDYP